MAKQLIIPSITFTPGAASVGTIVFNNFRNFDFRKLYAIINQRTGALLYAAGSTTNGYSSISGTTLTFQISTVGMISTDPLEIIYDTDSAAVKGENNAWRYGFGGTSLDTTQMTLLQTGPGMSTRVGSISKDATWTRSTTTCTVTYASHGMITNDVINILVSSEPLAIPFGSIIITVVDANTFTFTCTNAGAASGTLSYGQDISSMQIVTGTTPGSETILKSAYPFSGAMDANISLHINQRIANQEFRFGLYEISSTLSAISWTRSGTVATITSNAHGLVAGQEIQVPVSSDTGAITLSTFQVSTTPTTNTFTINCINAGATSGTLSYFSYNSVIEYKWNTTSATTATLETFKDVWDSAAAATTVASTLTALSIFKIRFAKGRVEFLDSTIGSNASEITRVIKDKELPDINGTYFAMVRVRNLATAPASSTTVSLSFVEVNLANPIQVELNQKGSGNLHDAMGVNVLVMPSITIAAISQTAMGGQGTNNKSMGIFVSASGTLAAYAAQAWAAASGNGATLTNEIGTVACYDINLTAWTVGTSTGLVIALQWSPDNGTTWYDQWITEPMTATGHIFIPAVNTPGRVRMRWFHVSGSATTATVTVTAMCGANNLPQQFQYFDRTAGVGSGNAVLNTSSASYIISGTKSFTVVMNAGTATAVGSFKVQMSMDGNNWYDASAALPISSTTANMTLIPITSGVTGRFLKVICTAAGTSQVINSIGINAVN
jgi:hypothetical protein